MPRTVPVPGPLQEGLPTQKEACARLAPRHHLRAPRGGLAGALAHHQLRQRAVPGGRSGHPGGRETNTGTTVLHRPWWACGQNDNTSHASHARHASRERPLGEREVLHVAHRDHRGNDGVEGNHLQKHMKPSRELFLFSISGKS